MENYIHPKNNGKKQLFQELGRIYNPTWNEMISSAAYCPVEEKNSGTNRLFPLADDVKKIHIYMTEKQAEFYQQLQDEKSSKNWTNLARGSLTQIILYNGRRESKGYKMQLETVDNKDKSSPNEDVAKSLSQLDKSFLNWWKFVGNMEGRFPSFLFLVGQTASVSLKKNKI